MAQLPLQKKSSQEHCQAFQKLVNKHFTKTKKLAPYFQQEQCKSEIYIIENVVVQLSDHITSGKC